MFAKAKEFISADRRNRLAQIDQLIAEGDRRIEQQRRIVSQIVDEEGDPAAALALLKSMEEAQSNRYARRGRINRFCA
jgi:hypothetical protein